MVASEMLNSRKREFSKLNKFSKFKIIFSGLLILSLLMLLIFLFVGKTFGVELTENSIENNVTEKIIAAILFSIGLLYFVDIVISIYKQHDFCKFEYRCSKSYSFSEYLKHSIVIFLLAFSLGILGSLESISTNIEKISISSADDYINKFKSCIDKSEDIHKQLQKRESSGLKRNFLAPCNKKLSIGLTDDADKTTALVIYTFYSIFPNVLIALIAIELTTAYFVSGHSKSQPLVTGLLIASIIDIISFVTLKTVVAQPNLPTVDIPRYHIEIGFMLGNLSLLAFISSFEAIQYSQVKVDHSLNRFNVLKQLAEIIKNGSVRNRIEIEATLQDYDYLPRIKILTELLKKNGYNVRCEMFHDLNGNTSFFKSENYDEVVNSLINKDFNIDKENLNDIVACNKEVTTNIDLLIYLLRSSNIDRESLTSLYYCLVNEVEVFVVENKIKDTNKKTVNKKEIIKYLETAGFQTNRYRHEETIELILNYYVNSKVVYSIDSKIEDYCNKRNSASGENKS